MYEAEPGYQQSVQSTGYRTAPDVAFVADPASGVWIADPYNLPGSNPWQTVGGTSLASPAWASLIALANQGRVEAGEGTLGSSADPTATQEAIYNLPQSDFNSITTGFNGFNAGAGYNLVTGLGTPIVNQLIPDLIANTVSANAQRSITVTASDLQAYVGVGGSGGIPSVINVFDAVMTHSTDHVPELGQSQPVGSGVVGQTVAKASVADTITTLNSKASLITRPNDYGKDGFGNGIENANLFGRNDMNQLSVVHDNVMSIGTPSNILLNVPNNDALIAIGSEGPPYGDNRDEVLISGTGNDVLVGGDGSDVTIGSWGNDVMIGGFGSAPSIKNAADDILSGGDTHLDDQLAALDLTSMGSIGSDPSSDQAAAFESIFNASVVSDDGDASQS